jgi:hypothetical protein
MLLVGLFASAHSNVFTVVAWQLLQRMTTELQRYSTAVTNSLQLLARAANNRQGPRRKQSYFVSGYGPVPGDGSCVVVCLAVVS